MPADERYRHELEHLWKMRADNAKTRLDRAAACVAELSDNAALPETDAGTHNHAIRVYTQALEDYTNISKTYHDLVLHGKAPGKQQPLRPRGRTSGQQ